MLPEPGPASGPTEESAALKSTGAGVPAKPIPIKRAQHPKWRALLAIAFLLGSAILAILVLSSPSARDVHLNGEMDSFVLPRAVDLQMPEVDRVHLRKLEMNVSRIAEIVSGGSARRLNAESNLILRDAGSDAESAATLRLSNRKGPLELIAPQGARIDAPLTPSSAVSIRFQPPAGQRIRLSLEAETISVEANRVLVKPDAVAVAPGGAPNYSFTMIDRDEMVHIDSSSAGESTATLTSDQELSVLPGGTPMGTTPAEPIRLHDIRVKDALIRGAKDSEMSLNVASDVDIIPGKEFMWTAISAVRTPGPPVSCSIRLSGHGTASSLRQDGRELLPSRLADLMSADPAHRGIFGGMALFLVFAWGVLFKRAIDIVAKAVLPE